MIWKGASAAAPANPQANWAYYNTAAVDGAYPSFAATVTLQGNPTVPAEAQLLVPPGLTLNKNGYTVTGSVMNTGGLVFE